MKKIYLFLLLCCCISFMADAKKIHVLLILDTDFYSRDVAYHTELQTGAANIRMHVVQEAKFLMRHWNLTEQDVCIYEVSGEHMQGKRNFTAQGLVSVLDTMTNHIQQGDCVITATYTHGMRSDRNTTVAPELCIGPAEAYDYFYFDDILLKIERKKPSLMLSIVTACQADLHIEVAQGPRRTSARYERTELGRATAVSLNRRNSRYQYECLFDNPDYANFKTVSIEFYSCAKGQVSYVDSYGGVFFKEFLRALDEKISRGGNYKINWNIIAQAIKDNVEPTTENCPNGLQSPVALVRYIKENGTQVPIYLTESRKKPTHVIIDTLSVKFQHTDILKGRRQPSLDLCRRFVKLGASYMMYGSRANALKVADTVIYFLKKKVDYNEKHHIKPGKKNINDAGDAMYYLAMAYEIRASAMDYEANPAGAKESLEKAFELYEKLNAISSKEVIEKCLQKFNTGA
jgi:hypothetical protein